MTLTLKLLIIICAILPLIVSIYQLYSYKYYGDHPSEKTKKNIEFSKKLNWLTIIICCLTLILMLIK